ncbi:MAG: hypothetical protein KC493_02575 [Bacteriovoracaceae bacterium]|nr:hypothetical protein [Bacteriovoracaceae bacterium]
MNFFKDSDIEEEFQFNRSEMWLDLENVDSEFEEEMLPHSKAYVDSSRPMWLFYVKSIEKLGYFSWIHSRDGSLGLIRFFSKFPEPNGIKTKILMNKMHYRLVPNEWKENILLYENVRTVDNYDNEVVYLAITGHELATSLPALEAVCKKINNLKGVQRVVIVPFNLTIKGTESLSQGESFLCEASGLVYKNINTSVSTLNMYKLQFENLNGKLFLNLNSNLTLFSESYFDFYMKSRGAVSLNDEYVKNIDGNVMETGAGYGIRLCESWPSDYQKVRDKIDTTFNKNLDSLLKNDLESQENPVFFNLELSTFDHWVKSI